MLADSLGMEVCVCVCMLGVWEEEGNDKEANTEGRKSVFNE